MSYSRVIPATPAGRLLVLVAGLLFAVAASLVVQAWLHDPRPLASVQFHSEARGLGLGASLRPRWCFENFDPRLGRCTCIEQPLAAGHPYGTDHATVTAFGGGPSGRR